MTTYEYMLMRNIKGLDVTPERIVCAANKTPLGTIILGARHNDEIMVETARLLHMSLDDVEEGFYTSWQRFVTREDGMVIAKAQGQIYRKEGTQNPEVLHSECLY